MATNGPEERSGREIGLLVLVIAVALAVLLVLARFRFPAAALTTAPPSPGPFERIAARATFDELASTVAHLADRVGPMFVTVQIDRAPARGRAAAPGSVSERKFAPAIRVRPDLLLVYLPNGMQVVAVGAQSSSVDVAAADDRREIALIRVMPIPDEPNGLTNPASDFSGSSYVAVVEGALGGPSVRPVFVGRTDPSPDVRWLSAPLMVGGDSQISPGTFVFTLEGKFVGLAVREDVGVAIVLPAALARAVSDLVGGSAP